MSRGLRHEQRAASWRFPVLIPSTAGQVPRAAPCLRGVCSANGAGHRLRPFHLLYPDPVALMVRDGAVVQAEAPPRPCRPDLYVDSVARRLVVLTDRQGKETRNPACYTNLYRWIPLCSLGEDWGSRIIITLCTLCKPIGTINTAAGAAEHGTPEASRSPS